ncbi:MAG: hypothetical protein NC429_09565 [Lachnospiraceae bacterium]|nr:hypothetical protein [Lachnospiraceae bacterium]
MMNLKYYLRGLGVGIVVTVLIMSIALGGKESLSNEEIKERARALGMVEGGTLIEDAQTALNNMGASGGEVSDEEASGQEVSNKEASDEETSDEGAETPADDGEQPPEGESQSAEESQSGEGQEPADETEASEGAESMDDPQPIDGQQYMVDPEQTEEARALEEPSPSPEPEEKPVFTGRDEPVTIQVNRGEGSYTVCKRLEQAGLIESASEFDNYLYQNGYDKKIRAGSFEIPAGAGEGQIAGILIGTQ